MEQGLGPTTLNCYLQIYYVTTFFLKYILWLSQKFTLMQGNLVCEHFCFSHVYLHQQWLFNNEHNYYDPILLTCFDLFSDFDRLLQHHFFPGCVILTIMCKLNLMCKFGGVPIYSLLSREAFYLRSLDEFTTFLLYRYKICRPYPYSI